MRRRLEDELVQAAFEDLGPDRVAEVERLAGQDPDAAQALAAYRQMKEDLRCLRGVPEHQLSTERLRHAILHQGLKPKPARNWGWTWMPAATMVLAALFTLMLQNRDQGGTAVVGIQSPDSMGSVARNAEPVPDLFNFELSEPSTAAAVASVSTDEPSRTDETTTRRKVDRPAKRAERGTAMLASAPAAAPNNSSVDGDEATPYTGMAELAEAVASGADSGTEPPIVLIASEPDAFTGANRAMEVETASNVLIGG